MKILIADDSRLIRKKLKALISEIPEIKDFTEAESSGEAIVCIEVLKPDIVILDIRMPNGGGIELLGEINKKNLPVKKIVLTNYPYFQYKKRCFELGADYFFDKSTEFVKIVDLVKNLAGERFS